MNDEQVIVQVSLGWVDAGPPGWLLLHRRIRRSTGEFDEYWRSNAVTALDLITLRSAALEKGQWRALLEGVRLERVTLRSEPHAIRLTLLAAEADRKTGTVRQSRDEQDQARRTVPMDEATVRYAVRHDLLEVRDAVARTATDAGIAGPVLRSVLTEVDLVGRDGGVPRRFSADGRDELPAPRIVLRGVRGAQIGDHNVQINRFVARNEDMLLDFDRVLRRDDVQEAAGRLRRSPDDTALRHNLERVLRNAGRTFFAKRQVLVARSEEHATLLRGLLTFESRGVQVGDNGEQRNTFFYAVRSPDSARLVSDDPHLRRALAEYLCPRGRSEGDFAPLRSALEESVSRMPVKWDRARLLQFRTPEPGETLRVNRADAVSIGAFREVRFAEEVAVRVTTRADRIRLPDRGAVTRAADPTPDRTPEVSRNSESLEELHLRTDRQDRHTDPGRGGPFGRF